MTRLTSLVALATAAGLVACRPSVATNAIPAVFDPSRMAAYSDSFVTVIQGEPRGWHRYAVESAANGWRFTDAFAIGNEMSRVAEVSLDSALHVLTSEQRGHFLGRPTRVRVTYRGRRVSGTALAPRGTTVREVHVDTVLPPEAFDGVALMGLLPTLDWRPGAVYRLTLFDPEENSTSQQVLRISGPESLTVPAGTFETLRGDLTTTQAPVRIWVTRRKPHRVVKVGGSTEDFITVLVTR